MFPNNFLVLSKESQDLKGDMKDYNFSRRQGVATRRCVRD
jgi:hypothetical protein